MFHHHGFLFRTFLYLIFFYDVSHGVLTQLCTGTTIEGARLNGKYIWARVRKVREGTQDLQQGMELWNWLEGQVENV
ncbi:hypothetical protein M405DRAFT_798223 [Rhizopogon salebrosus TDB-379]|nr:hypothetical protein M405DRAFT_798223 [Rhizopogon salebrosus TDB-379]